MKRNNWLTINYEVTSQQQQAKKRPLSREFVRKMNQHERGQTSGNFQCPTCKHYFSLSYSKFGKFGCFESPTYYCLDCSSNSRFVKI